MKIIFGANSFDIEKAATEEMKADRKRALKRGEFTFAGIAYHLARYPHVCEDCGETYWATDEHYYFHPGCQYGKGKTGF